MYRWLTILAEVNKLGQGGAATSARFFFLFSVFSFIYLALSGVRKIAHDKKTSLSTKNLLCALCQVNDH